MDAAYDERAIVRVRSIMDKNSVAQRLCQDSAHQFDRIDFPTSTLFSRWLRACAAGARLLVACVLMLGLCAPIHIPQQRPGDHGPPFGLGHMRGADLALLRERGAVDYKDS